MGIRIESIKINQGGPLLEDFLFQPGDLNVIYGRNEVGKTYILESLIRLLFRTNGKSIIDKSLRKLDCAGRIVVSGLKDEPLQFKKDSKKLEDYWERDAEGLPLSFKNLLVVRAGETSLSDQADGVGRNILKDCLTDDGILDEVGGKISSTIQSAKINGHVINGRDQGELRTRNGNVNTLEKINTLFGEIDRDYETGTRVLLLKERAHKEEELAALEKAKRQHAGNLQRASEGLEKQIRSLPNEEKCIAIEAKIYGYGEKLRECNRHRKELSGIAPAAENHLWGKQALENYEEIMRKREGRPGRCLLITGILAFCLSVLFGIFNKGQNIGALILDIGWDLGAWFLDKGWGKCVFLLDAPITWVFGIFTALTFYCLWRYLVLQTKSDKVTAGDDVELVNLMNEFERRFNRPLSDKATIQNQVEDSREKSERVKFLKRELEELRTEIVALEKTISDLLAEYEGLDLIDAFAKEALDASENAIDPGVDVDQGKIWLSRSRSLREKRNNLDEDREKIGKDKAALGISEHRFLYDNPDVSWNREDIEVREQINRINEDIRSEEEKLQILKGQITQEVGQKATNLPWENLLDALQKKKNEAVEDYKQITAEILGKIQVYTVLERLRTHENEKIKNGLRDSELSKRLKDITGRYSGITLNSDASELILSSENDENFDLSNLSTGARAQVLMALRMGIASFKMQQKSAFLLLDDAYQHSDWNRRENLVRETLKMVDAGWQVFYFTMDDHLRDLFGKAGGELGERFQTRELKSGTNSSPEALKFKDETN